MPELSRLIQHLNEIMYIVNDIAYADTKDEDKEISYVKALDDMMMILTFKSGEKRLFDASTLLAMPAYKKLNEPSIFFNPIIDHGVVTWDDGKIDIAPETMYECSFQYP